MHIRRPAGVKRSCPHAAGLGKNSDMKLKISSLLAIVTAVFVCAPGVTQAQYQTRNMHFGVSGGNINDISRRFCCSGTLGSLVNAGTTQYILSNNHVLARTDQATPGEDVSQPGLVDTNCQPTTIVADYTIAVPLGNNVDCAIAEVRSGQMDSTGFIEPIGPPSSSIASPSVGMAVAKSGRTTGHTTGTIASINTSVRVQYQPTCGSGKKRNISYTNQVLINGSTFSAGGDSGSLITTNDGCYHPVALLFAGSSSTTIGNPIGEVMSKLSAQLGASLSFVGTNCTGPGSPQFGAFQLPQHALDHANALLERNRQDLMSLPAVLGVGLRALDDSSTAAVVVYVDKTSSTKPQLPAQLDGVPVRVVMTDPFIAF